MRKRSGFTLVEVMVAMALTLFIMTILSQAFITSLDVFSSLKAIGDMQEQLRTATTIMRNDLSQDHFEGKRRLSDLRTTPFREGFFVVRQSTAVSPTIAPYFKEGSEDGVDSFVATNHVLHFTVKLRGNNRQSFFSAGPFTTSSPLITGATNYAGAPVDSVMGDVTTFNSQWAEVAYFLKPTVIGPGGTTQLYALYRCQYVIAPAAANLTVIDAVEYAKSPAYANIAVNNVTFKFSSAADMASDFTKRTYVSQPTYDTNPRAAALLMTDVVSFQVQVLGSSGGDFVDLNGLPGFVNPAPFIYDSASATGQPFASIVGVKITLRVWDRTTEQTRQVTLIQDL